MRRDQGLWMIPPQRMKGTVMMKLNGDPHVIPLSRQRSGFRPEVIERQLAHKEKDKIRRAYNHATYLDERRQLMQWWSDFLDQCAAGQDGIPNKN